MENKASEDGGCLVPKPAPGTLDRARLAHDASPQRWSRCPAAIGRLATRHSMRHTFPEGQSRLECLGISNRDLTSASYHML